MRMLSIPALCAAWLVIGCSQAPKDTGVHPGALKDQTVEVGCAQCVYHMSGVQACEMAAVVNGQPMLLTGVEVDLHEHGLCSGAAEAVVSGRVVDGELVATELEIK